MRLTFDDYVLDVAGRELCRGSKPIAVEPQVFDLLVYLVQNPDRVIGKDELFAGGLGWPHRVGIGDNQPHQCGASRDRRFRARLSA